jgi:hypothetical protein
MVTDHNLLSGLSFMATTGAWQLKFYTETDLETHLQILNAFTFSLLEILG